jgi:hypothetical protein
MDKVERARELFRQLESSGAGCAAEIAKRTFLIEDSLSSMRR